MSNQLNKVPGEEISKSKKFFTRLFSGSRLDLQLLENVQSGNIEEVKKLLLHGANVNAKDEMKTTALMLACDFNMFDMVSLLINNGANLDATNSLGFTAFHYAAQRNDIRIIRLLVNNDDVKVEARLNKKDDKGNTPLHFAVASGNSEMVDFLLKRKANRYIENNEKHIPMDIARKKGFESIVTLLRQKI